jgi:uncharacterized protein (DUF433 family)
MIAAGQETLTTTEAAVVAGITLRNVNRAIDEKILPEALYTAGKSGARRINAEACVFLSFYFEAAHRLTSEERLRIIVAASQQRSTEPESDLEEQWLIRQEFLTIDLAPFLSGVRQRLARLKAARELVVEDPEILNGTPVIRGTRVPVYDVAALANAGEPIKDLLEDYPRINANAICLAQLFAEANPLQGKPRRFPSLPAGATIVAHYRVPADRVILQKLAS